MNDYILKRYYRFVDEKSAAVSPAPASKEDIEKQDHLMALQLQRSEANAPKTRRGATAKVTKRKTTKTGTPRAANSPFNAEHVVSPQLQAIVGSSRMSRPQVVKQMWIYIKAHELQDPSDKRKVVCDAKLQQLFKKSTVGMFEMNKLLTKHLYKEEDVVNRAPWDSVKKEKVEEEDEGEKDESEDGQEPDAEETKVGVAEQASPEQTLEEPVKDEDLSEISDVDD